jgi:hypothetical protein
MIEVLVEINCETDSVTSRHQHTIPSRFSLIFSHLSNTDSLAEARRGANQFIFATVTRTRLQQRHQVELGLAVPTSNNKFRLLNFWVRVSAAVLAPQPEPLHKCTDGWPWALKLCWAWYAKQNEDSQSQISLRIIWISVYGLKNSKWCCTINFNKILWFQFSWLSKLELGNDWWYSVWRQSMQ